MMNALREKEEAIQQEVEAKEERKRQREKKREEKEAKLAPKEEEPKELRRSTRSRLTKKGKCVESLIDVTQGLFAWFQS